MRVKRLLIALIAAAGVVLSLRAAPASDALVELQVKQDKHVGRVVARNSAVCWVEQSDGRRTRLRLRDVTAFKKLPGRYSAFGAAEMRDSLRREFGKTLEISATSHYIVCAPSGKGATYGRVFEDVYRTFSRYFSTRGFATGRPEFPLVAIIFPDQATFAKYSLKDGIRATPGLMGYYLPESNRIALFDPGDLPAAQGGSATSDAGVRSPIGMAFGDIDGLKRAPEKFELMNAASRPVHAAVQGSIESDLLHTIVHEGTHQIAFNTGLHSRIGESPKWVVEGLATVFEAPGIRDSSAGGAAGTRINTERFLWFGNYRKARRPEKSLEAFIAGDGLFQKSVLDAYAESWALTFFLIETRPREYASYLKRIAARDQLVAYPGSERLDDFRAEFGKDVGWLETEYLRFITRLK